jgi:hypothetical protein
VFSTLFRNTITATGLHATSKALKKLAEPQFKGIAAELKANIADVFIPIKNAGGQSKLGWDKEAEQLYLRIQPKPNDKLQRIYLSPGRIKDIRRDINLAYQDKTGNIPSRLRFKTSKQPVPNNNSVSKPHHLSKASPSTRQADDAASMIVHPGTPPRASRREIPHHLPAIPQTESLSAEAMLKHVDARLEQLQPPVWQEKPHASTCPEMPKSILKNAHQGQPANETIHPKDQSLATRADHSSTTTRQNNLHAHGQATPPLVRPANPSPEEQLKRDNSSHRPPKRVPNSNAKIGKLGDNLRSTAEKALQHDLSIQTAPSLDEWLQAKLQEKLKQANAVDRQRKSQVPAPKNKHEAHVKFEIPDHQATKPKRMELSTTDQPDESNLRLQHKSLKLLFRHMEETPDVTIDKLADQLWPIFSKEQKNLIRDFDQHKNTFKVFPHFRKEIEGTTQELEMLNRFTKALKKKADSPIIRIDSDNRVKVAYPEHFNPAHPNFQLPKRLPDSDSMIVNLRRYSDLSAEKAHQHKPAKTKNRLNSQVKSAPKQVDRKPENSKADEKPKATVQPAQSNQSNRNAEVVRRHLKKQTDPSVAKRLDAILERTGAELKRPKAAIRQHKPEAPAPTSKSEARVRFDIPNHNVIEPKPIAIRSTDLPESTLRFQQAALKLLLSHPESVNPIAINITADTLWSRLTVVQKQWIRSVDQTPNIFEIIPRSSQASPLTPDQLDILKHLGQALKQKSKGL